MPNMADGENERERGCEDILDRMNVKRKEEEIRREEKREREKRGKEKRKRKKNGNELSFFNMIH
jgi:hypothetical protein